MPLACRSLIWFPIAVVIVLPCTFLLTFAIAVSLGHVEADFPYISDTGTRSPESCIFGQFMNIGAVLVGITIYIRYKQVNEYTAERERIHKVNAASLVIGLMSALGISIVGNFQETNVLVMHVIGAMLAFGLGCVYCVIHTVISYRLQPAIGNSAIVCHIRAVLCVIAAITFVITKVFDSIARQQFHGKDPRKWFPTDGGFTPHIISTASEWTMCAAQLIFFVTFIPEFRAYKMSTPELVLLVAKERTGPLLIDDDIIT